MTRFVTLDVNGWFDHLVDEDGDVKALGFRSCLYQHKDTWLFGAQALSAARDARTRATLIDAIDALAPAAGLGNCLPLNRSALPAALWELVTEAARRVDNPAHLALVIPDGRYLGIPNVQKETGKTALETLHYALVEARPTTLTRSRVEVELVWRSVAALKAVMDRGEIGDKPGAVLVISVNRRIFWTVLELRAWPPNSPSTGPLHIVRKPVMDNCEENEAWTARRMEAVRTALVDQGADDLEAFHRWTRYVEILATGMSQEALAELGIDMNAIEHRSWPIACGKWEVWRDAPSIQWAKASLPRALEQRIVKFRSQTESTPLAIIVESPVGLEMTVGFEALVRELAAGIRILRVTGADTARAASRLADALGLDPQKPAWLDEVPGIDLKVRKRESVDGKETDTSWMPVVPRNEAIPAGETYHTCHHEDRRVTLAPGIEHIHLHLRRGNEGAWDERYSGWSTGHTIRPSDHVRIVEPLARVRPLSEEARIEIVEHLPNGTFEALAASISSIKWSDMATDRPEAFHSIPELYIFEASQEGWNDLKPLLHRVVNAGEEEIGYQLKNDLYKCTQKQWNERKFPLGSDGRPPRTNDPQQHQASLRLLRESTDALLRDLESKISSREKLKPGIANRLHMPLTWLFTGCPERAVEVLLDAIADPQGNGGRTLHIDDRFSAWSIYSGVGRAARSEDSLRRIYDTLIGEWERTGGRDQDKFLLAAVTHPMARRVAVRRVLNENEERFQRVKRFLHRQLENLLKGDHDQRLRRNGQPHLELRYITMGYRGLCQVRYDNPKWFDALGEDAKETYNMLLKASILGGEFERNLVERTAPYLIGEGLDPSMPGRF
ncbi:MAG: hypothetical protein OXE44_01810 [Nitrospinae bacterium]|nr:hypothetical protein [Nitrospinota bacterium]